MYVNKNENNKQKLNRGNDHKNKKPKSIISFNEAKMNSKLMNNYIGQTKKEIIRKRQEDQSFYNKKSGRNQKQKSTDNSIFNKSLYNNSVLSFNNKSQKKINKQPKKLNKENLNNIFKENSNIQNNISSFKESNKNNFNKDNLNINTNNIKNTQYHKTQNLTSGSNYSLFSFSNIVNDQTSSNENFEESKDNFYNNENLKLYNGKIITTFLQIDDLTPIPDRIGGKQHKLAEYDYDEAKRAAVTCRRIEYSYNLRNVVKSEICLDEIITIQRWWRDILKRRNDKIMKELQLQEKIKLNNLENYVLFINKIHYIYTMHLVKKFMNRLKIKYGKLYYKNLFNRKASKIQNAYRSFISRKKLKSQLKLQEFLKKLYIKKQKRKLLDFLNKCIMDINRIIKLQNYIKYHQLKNKESYYLKLANEVHPYMYYYSKYGLKNNNKNNNKIKHKINGLHKMIQKWKYFTNSKKLLNTVMFLENIKFILRKKYFIYFIILLVERINAEITYFLLKPLMKNILNIYYNNKMKNILLCWKSGIKRIKRRDSLALNIILKLINRYAFKPFIKKLKNKE